MPTYLHDIVLLYLSVLDARDGSDPHERNLVGHLAHRWAPEADSAEVEAVVETAYLAARSGLDIDPEALAQDLCDQLPTGGCKRLLSDLGALARADGHLTQHEAETISLVRNEFARRRYAAGAHASI